jgi:uncharacterized protein (DUF1800 family)
MVPGLIALNRFGLGKRAWEPLPADAKSWLTTQFARYKPEIAGASTLATRAQLAEDIAELREAARTGRLQNIPTTAQQMAAQPDAGTNKQMRAETRQYARDQHIAQIGLRLRSAVASDTPFVERLVHFWANHFAISVDKLVTIGMGGLLEFEAIRPHVLGRFEDMLLAVERHPAMLLYLDQAQSVGPGSMAGQRAARNGRKLGLNENLAREILELHTLGVRSGYSQADVTEFARALTGWTVAGLGRGPAARLLERGAGPGDFVFADLLHEPGTRTILGKSYRQDGEAQARAVLADLAASPATAHHLCTKLARHFVADDPPEALVARLEQAWMGSHGDLPTVYRALIASPEAWVPAPAKFRTPWQWGVAVFRAVSPRERAGFPDTPDRALAGMFVELGQPVWRPGSPAGFDDIAASWAAPDALYRRVEMAGRIASQAPASLDPRQIAGAVLGPSLTGATREAIAHAENTREGLSLLLVSPEMLRC